MHVFGDIFRNAGSTEIRADRDREGDSSGRVGVVVHVCHALPGNGQTRRPVSSGRIAHDDEVHCWVRTVPHSSYEGSKRLGTNMPIGNRWAGCQDVMVAGKSYEKR